MENEKVPETKVRKPTLYEIFSLALPIIQVILSFAYYKLYGEDTGQVQYHDPVYTAFFVSASILFIINIVLFCLDKKIKDVVNNRRKLLLANIFSLIFFVLFLGSGIWMFLAIIIFFYISIPMILYSGAIWLDLFRNLVLKRIFGETVSTTIIELIFICIFICIFLCIFLLLVSCL